MAVRTRKASAAVRADALEAAVRVLERDGLEKVTVRSVAMEAEVSVASIYNHYVDKDGLLSAITTKQFEDLRGRFAMIAGMGERLDPRTLLVEAVVEYHDFALRRPESYRLMFSGQMDDIPTALSAFESFTKLVEKGQKSGIFAPTRPAEVIAKLIFSTCHGAVMLEINQVNLQSVPLEPRDISEIIVEGISSSVAQSTKY